MSIKISYNFNAKVWKHSANNGWYFVSLPKELGTELRNNLRWQEQGWGRMHAEAKIGTSTWKTAIWFDTKLGTYLLPLKQEIRKKEKIEIENVLCVEISI